MDNFYIYKYVNNKNNIIYIGKTNNIERRIKEHKKDKLKNFNGDIYYFTCSNKINMDMLEYVLINKYHPKYNIQYNDFSIQTDMQEPEWILYKEKEKPQEFKQVKIYNFKPKNININALGNVKQSFDLSNIDNKNIFLQYKLNLSECKIICALLLSEKEYNTNFISVSVFQSLMNLKGNSDLYPIFESLEKKKILKKFHNIFTLEEPFITDNFLYQLNKEQLEIILKTNCKYLPYFIDKINLEKKEIKIERDYIEEHFNYKNANDMEKRMIIPILNTLNIKNYTKNHTTAGRKILTFIYNW